MSWHGTSLTLMQMGISNNSEAKVACEQSRLPLDSLHLFRQWRSAIAIVQQYRLIYMLQTGCTTHFLQDREIDCDRIRPHHCMLGLSR